MHGGAVTLADQFLRSNFEPDLILVSDMLDLTTFIASTRSRSANIPIVTYFHENQITYPWSPTDRDIPKNRDYHYGFINVTSAYTSDACLFNSNFHMDSFINSLPGFLNAFPDEKNIFMIDNILEKSSVLHLGIDLKIFDEYQNDSKNEFPVILWNHRWEYDKNPESFFNLLFKLDKMDLDFKVIVLGENFSKSPEIFEEARRKLGNKIIHFGYAESFDDYASLLWKVDILPVTSNQEFFGASVMEAVYCDAIPLLPNRLTYPELFPDNCIYNSEKELELELIQMIKDHPNKGESFKNVAAAYDWTAMGPVYDKKLTEIVASKESGKKI